MLKRAFELVLFIVALPLVVPVSLVVSVLVLLAFGRPILFRQARGGLDGTQFMLFKFRTMTNERAPDGALLPDEQRLTRFGRILRSTSLDELPSLINFARGDIALVGPRPFMARYLPLYSAEQARRHEVLPGLTGLAQVMGRNALSWEEKFELDIWYVDHRSFWLDLKILLLTVRQVLFGRGVSAPGEATAPLFRGSSRETSDD